MRKLNIADAIAIWLAMRNSRDWQMSKAEQALEEWASKTITDHARGIVKELENAPPEDWIRVDNESC